MYKEQDEFKIIKHTEKDYDYGLHGMVRSKDENPCAALYKKEA